jgi:DMSO/TMAO reductase YedYZ molybdopterin-dependent catalytic subunit
VFCVDLRTDSESAVYSIKWLVFISVVGSVHSAVRTDCLYKAGFYNRGGKSSQRGMDWLLYQAGFYNRGGKSLQRGMD